jgi:hypothetical protein
VLKEGGASACRLRVTRTTPALVFVLRGEDDRGIQVEHEVLVPAAFANRADLRELRTYGERSVPYASDRVTDAGVAQSSALVAATL